LLYNNVLGRAPDQHGLADWSGRLVSGVSRSEVLLGFSESTEFKQQTAAEAPGGIWVQSSEAASIARLYYAALDRAPDLSGLSDWTQALESGQNLSEIAGGFTNSTEFQTRYGALDNTQFVDLLYHNVLDRAPDAGGLANWLDALSHQSREEVLLGFSQSQEFKYKMQPYLDGGFILA
jgi:hypothetical protein